MPPPRRKYVLYNTRQRAGENGAHGWKEVFFLAAAFGSERRGVLNRGRGRGQKQCRRKHLPPDLRLRVGHLGHHLAQQILLLTTLDKTGEQRASNAMTKRRTLPLIISLLGRVERRKMITNSES
jgi:hypothetical protein